MAGTAIDPVFQRKKFLLRQKHFAINEKYYVWDEAGQNLLFIERPAHFLKSLLAVAAGFLALGIVVAASAGVGALLGQEAMPIAVAIGVIVGFVALGVVAVVVSPKRHVYFYRDDTKGAALMSIEQDQKFAPLVATYTVKDASGTVLALLKKNYLFNLVRKR